MVSPRDRRPSGLPEPEDVRSEGSEVTDAVEQVAKLLAQLSGAGEKVEKAQKDGLEAGEACRPLRLGGQSLRSL